MIQRIADRLVEVISDVIDRPDYFPEPTAEVEGNVIQINLGNGDSIHIYEDYCLFSPNGKNGYNKRDMEYINDILTLIERGLMETKSK